MPFYKIDKNIYNVPESDVEEFEKNNPNATVRYQHGKNVYDVPVSERGQFLDNMKDVVPFDWDPYFDGGKKGGKTDAVQPEGKRNQAAYIEDATAGMGQRTPTDAKHSDGSMPESEIQRLKKIKYDAQQEIDSAGFFDRFFNPETRMAVATRNQAEQALETYEEAKHSDNGWFDRNVLGVFRGIGDKIGDLDTWDFGASGIASAVALKDAAEKSERGEPLTASERRMLDAYGLASAVQSAYQDKVGMAYNVGTSLPESAGFMVSLAANPAAGLGKKVAERAAKTAVKKYGKTLVSKLAKGAARVGGDMAEMAIATATTGAGRVAEDYYNRLNGEQTFDIDDNGIIRWGGRENQEEADSAIWKAFGSQFIENYSEKMGEYMSPLGKKIGEYMSPLGEMISGLTYKGLKKANLNNLADEIGRISSSQLSTGIQKLKEKTLYDGLVGEYLEEVAGNIMNASTVGDMNFGNPEDQRSVFNPETNIETFLSCALMSGTMLAVETSVNTYNSRKMKRSLDDADKNASGLWGEDRWSDMRNQMDESDPQQLAQWISSINNSDDLSDEQKKAAMGYAGRLLQYQAFNARKMQNQMESTEETNAINNSYDEGTETVEPAERHEAKIRMERAESALGANSGDAERESFASMVMAGKDNPVESIRKMGEQGYTEEQIENAKEYYVSYFRMKGMTDSLLDDVESQVQQYNNDIDNNTHKDYGYVMRVQLNDGTEGFVIEGFVVQGQTGEIDGTASDDEVAVRMKDGQKRIMNPAKDIKTILSTNNAEDMKEYIDVVKRQQLIDNALGEINWNPSTPEPKVGDVFERNGQNVVVVSVDENGNMTVAPEEEERKSEGDISKIENTENVPVSEFKDFASAQIDAQQQQGNQQQQPSDINQTDDARTPEETPVNTPEIPTDKDGNIDFVKFGEENTMKFLSDTYGESSKERVKATTDSYEEELKKAEAAMQKAKSALDKAPIGKDIKQKKTYDTAVEAYNRAKTEFDFWNAINGRLNVPERQQGKDGIPLMDDGTPDFVKFGEDNTVNHMIEKYGEKSTLKAENTMKDAAKELESAKAEVEKAMKEYDNAPVGKEEKAEKKLAEAEAKLQNAKRHSDFWSGVFKQVQSRQKNPSAQAAAEIREMIEPSNGEELAANAVSGGGIRLLMDSFMKETGYSKEEARKFIGIFASKENGGLTIEEAGERLMQEDRENGANLFDQSDPNAGRNALIEMLSKTRTRGDITNFVRNNREEQARREEEAAMEAESQAKEEWSAQNFHMGYDDMQSYYEQFIQSSIESSMSRGEYDEFMANFADETINTEQYEQGISTESNQGDQVLPQAQPDFAGGEEVLQGGSGQDNNNSIDKGVPVQEGAPGSERLNAGSPVPSDNIEDVLAEAERISKEDEIQRTAASFPEETQEKASAFDGRIPGMTDEELLAYMREDGNGDSNGAYHPALYDEYDNRHVKDVSDSYDGYLQSLMDSGTTVEQAEEMLSNLTGDLSRFATSERPYLLGQEEALRDYISKLNQEVPAAPSEEDVYSRIEQASHEVDTNPTEAQIKAGNYKKGHVRVDGYDVTIENPKGSVRRGTDASGKEWSVTMNNTYGYIRGTEGVDDDHIDVFFSEDPSQGDVFVVDQVNKDGSFDEHKVMYGFASEDEARKEYLSNYEDGWQGLGAITHVTKEEFKKWVDSSHRKTKPFAEYKNVKVESAQNEAAESVETPAVSVASLSDEEVAAVIDAMKAHATAAPIIEITDDNWKDNIETPIGNVKMGAHQKEKLFAKSREQQYGMLVETLSKPDIVLEEQDKEQNMFHERPSSYLFVKTFQKEDGSKYVHFESVTVSQDGIEISVSSHIIREQALKRKLKSSNIIYEKETLFPNSSEMHLAEHQNDVSDLLPTQGNNVSGVKVRNNPAYNQENDIKSYKISSFEYTTKRGKKLDMKLVAFESELSKEQMNAAKKLAKDHKGWWSKNDGGFLMRDAESAQQLAELVLGDEGAVADAQPVTLEDMKLATSGTVSGREEGVRPDDIYYTGEELADALVIKEEQTPSDDATGTVADEQKGSGNKIVTDERYEQLKARMRKKLGQLNMSIIGIDPEMLAIGTEMAVYHIEKGARQFIPYAKAMIEDLGDAIRPYLKSFYNGARDLPEVEANGWTDEMTPYDEVRKIDVANFDKNTTNAMAAADMIVKEGQADQQAEAAKEHIIETRNNNRNEAEQQTEANTQAVADEAAAVASETESVVITGDASAINEQVSKIDEQLERVNKQLALLGYYEADTEDPSKFHESYGYMKTAEKKAVADALTFSLRLCKSLGVAAISKRDVQANIVPIGGDVTFRIPLSDGKSLYFNIGLDSDNGNLNLLRIMYRVEEKQDGAKYWNSVGHANNYLPNDVTVDDAINDIKHTLSYDAPWFEIKESEASTIAKQSKSNENNQKSKKKSIPLHQEQQPDSLGALFSDLNKKASETLNGNNNETTDVQPLSDEEGRGGHEPQQDAQVGRSAGHEAEGSDGQGMGGRNSKNTLSDGERSLGLSGIHQSQQYVEAATETNGKAPGTATATKNTNNNHAERGKDYAPKGIDARIEANIKAIELMQQLMLEGKKATPAQMKVLRQYSGWGGLGKAFNENPNGPYSYNPTTKRLKELLGDDAFRLAEDSRDSAFYTPAVVIDTMWDIARAMGFKGGTVLEGSAGIGNIIGAMPTDMSKRSDIHAVEIDETTGNILSLLYPDAKVDIQGFEQTKIANGSVDLAITNVPFVTGLNVRDESGDLDLSKKFRDIHDFCIAKNVRKLREGGIGIFITSNGTLDNSQKLRNWLVGEGGADVVGAFRLHNKTFGGAKVTSDIIVVRKRVNGQKSAHAIDVSTVTAERTGTFVDEKQRGKERTVSMDYNKYFMEHPECMAGEMFFGYEKGDNYRPSSKSLYPVNGKEQETMLAEWLKVFEGMKDEAKRKTAGNGGSGTEKQQGTVYESLGADVKEGSLILDKDGKLCVAQYGKAIPLSVNANKVKGHTKAECFQSYQAIKSALADVLAYQTENEGDEGLKPLLDKLNKAYDVFVKTYGHLHKNTSISFLKNDVDFPNILALEKHSEEGDKKGNKVDKFEKTDIFKQRVVEKDKAPEPKNVKDGIIASIYQYGRIDVPYIAEKVGKSVDDVKQEIVSSGLGFENPNTLQMEVSYEYLSGNVREKLKQAEEANEGGKYAANIEALRKVIPMDIPAHLIDFTLGSSWVEPKLYEDFIKERTDVDAQLTNVGGTWYMKVPYYVAHEKNKAMGVRGEVVKKLILGSELIEAALQNKTITVSETHSVGYGSSKTTETITDKEATQACAAKIDEIRADFKEWARQKMQSDAEMSARIEKAYNEQFNNYVPVDVSMDFVPEYFGGANHKFKMREHQAKAIVRGTMQPLLLAHEVGTGKTFTLISTAMEMRRLGTAKKPMIVVQNATVGQFVASAKELYPNAKVLTLEDKDHTGEGRKNFYAKIKYNDWDMIVVPQSVFERIPDSEERQMRFIQDKIDEKIAILEQMREADQSGRSAIVRQAEKEIEQLKDQLGAIGETATTKRKQRDSKREHITRQNTEVKAREMLDRETDDVENFDDMGIDAILVDEAHEYKHLGFATAMQRGVKGIDPSYSKKSQGVYLKTQAVLEKNNGRNVIFATGTPISNTAAEIWTFMRYLMPADTMKDYGIYYFDDFVRNFGNLTQMLEFTTNGKFKENNRFAGYVNLPELVRIWSSVADTVRTDEAQAVKDNVPDMEGGQAQDIYLPQTRALRSIMKFVKAELERFEKMSGKEKKKNSHIPLTMYGVAKAAAVDARLVMEDAEDDTNSKTNEAVRQTLKSLKETAKYKGTVALFADNYQNKHSGFNLYDDIREKLIAQGVPANEVVVIRSGMTIKKKQEIFDKVNRGDIRVILGSTFTLGTGVNIQERLHTLIHLDAPNRPMDYTQRNGRIVRQGNLHKVMGIPVRVLRFGVQDSLDVTAYQRLKTKGAIADSIMKGKAMMQNSMEDRAMEEDEDVFGDTVAQLSGSQYAMLKNQAEREVRKYESKRKQWEADQTYVHNAIPRITAQIAESERKAAENNANLAKIEEAFGGSDKPAIKVGKHTFADIAGMADFFTEQNKKVKETEDEIRKSAGEEQRTRTVDVQIGNATFTIKTTQKKELSYHGGTVDTKVSRSITISCPELGIEDMKGGAYFKNAMENIFNDVVSGSAFREDAAYYSTRAERLKGELELVKSREGQPFQYDKELEDSRRKFDEYTELMKKEMEEKEKKYAEMDSGIEAATGVAVNNGDEEEDDNLYRIVEDKSTVDQLEGKWIRREGDLDVESPVSDAGMSEMVKRVNELAAKLHIDNIDIVTDTSMLEGKKKMVKGFYNRKTGKITIVIGNHSDLADLEKTVLHEAVAHYGLRKLFGEHFDTFLESVYRNADADVRKRITELAAKHGWNFRTATEEYLAGLAEETDFANARKTGWWDKIKRAFLDMLHKIAFDEYDGDVLTDNELRYILWRSYRNLSEPGPYRSVLGEAEDIVMQDRLKVGNYSVDELYRSSEQEISGMQDNTARNMYERALKERSFRFTESFVDAQRALKEIQDAIAAQHGGRVDEWEDAYTTENQLSSRNTIEVENFTFNHFRPMVDSVSRLSKKAGVSYDEIKNYLFMKSGLERNRDFAVRDAIAMMENEGDDTTGIMEGYMNRKGQLVDQLKSGSITFREYCSLMDEEAEAIASDIIGKDYSGLSSLFPEDENFTEMALDAVESFEQSADTSEVWGEIRKSTQFALDKAKESGVISTDTHRRVSGMFEWYIPMRGWEDTTADEVYDYFDSKGEGGFNSTVKSAKGRTTVAYDPLATIANMAESAIFQGNRNKMKQRLLNLAFNKPTNLITVMDSWIVNRGTENNPQWEYAYPSIGENDTADEVAAKISDFERDMEDLRRNKMARKVKGKAEIPYIATPKQVSEHVIRVKRNGREFTMVINGNPRAAQAINGKTKYESTDGVVDKALDKTRRLMSPVMTTYNPTFSVRNFTRDCIFSNAAVFIKEDNDYGKRFRSNEMKVVAKIGGLMKRYSSGSLDMNKPIDKAFKEFLHNGGETGFVQLTSTEQYKKKIVKMIKESQGGRAKAKKAFDFYMEHIQFFNRCVEDINRFAIFLTSREMGRSITRSVSDAKEITVNFNRSGSGAKASGVFGLSAQMCRGLYIFFNAGVQSLSNFNMLRKKNPGRFAAALSVFAAAGFIVPFVNYLTGMLLGGDDDDYYDLPEWVRRNNLVLSLGRTAGGPTFFTVPLPVEMRAFYGLGETANNLLSGKIRKGDAAMQVVSQFAELLPVNFMEGGGFANSIMPTAIKPITEIVANKDFTGKPIYRNSGFNRDLPEWTKAYSGTSKMIVNAAELANEVTGGDKYVPGKVDVNPAWIDHLIGGYTGGFGQSISEIAGLLYSPIAGEIPSVNRVPVVKAFLNIGDDRTSYSKAKKDYAEYKKEYEQTVRRLNGYQHEMKVGDGESAVEYAERLDFLLQSDEMRIYPIMKAYEKAINKAYDMMRESPDADVQKSIEESINILKSRAVYEIQKLE